MSNWRHEGSLDAFMRAAYGSAPELTLAGQRIVVTGATRGLGRGVAAHALALGADLVLTCRRGCDDLPAVRADAEALLTQYGADKSSNKNKNKNMVDTVPLDLADLESVERGAEAIAARWPASMHACCRAAARLNGPGAPWGSGVLGAMDRHAHSKLASTTFALELARRRPDLLVSDVCPGPVTSDIAGGTRATPRSVRGSSRRPRPSSRPAGRRQPAKACFNVMLLSCSRARASARCAPSALRRASTATPPSLRLHARASTRSPACAGAGVPSDSSRPRARPRPAPSPPWPAR